MSKRGVLGIWKGEMKMVYFRSHGRVEGAKILKWQCWSGSEDLDMNEEGEIGDANSIKYMYLDVA